MLCSYNPAQFCKSDWNRAVAVYGYFYQKSLFTFGEEGLPFNENEISVKNSWARDHIIDEITKSYVGKILNECSDYIFVDALGCVVPLMEVNAGALSTKVTYNRYMGEACKKLVRNKKIYLGERITDFSEAEIRQYISSFCGMLLSRYSQEQIIIHRANYAEWYDYKDSIVQVSEEVKKNRRHMSERLKLIYQIMEVHMPQAHYIDMLPITSAQSMNSPFNYSRQYAEYLTGVVLSIMYPGDTVKYMQKVYLNVAASGGVHSRIEGAYAEVVQLVNDYQYKIELLNREILQYDERINETCSWLTGVMNTEHVAGDNELTYETFLKLKKVYVRRERRRSNILWRIFIYPFTKIKRYIEYIHMYGFVKATKTAVSYYKNYIKYIITINKGERK